MAVMVMGMAAADGPHAWTLAPSSLPSAPRIGHFSQGVGFRSTYTEIQGGTQTTHPPDYFITCLEAS
jgi:hypothetical protein